jgi:hypothetical protein
MTETLEIVLKKRKIEFMKGKPAELGNRLLYILNKSK